MTTMDQLFDLARPAINTEDKRQITLVLDPDSNVQETVSDLMHYFAKWEDQNAIRLLEQSRVRGYVLRTDLFKLVRFGTRTIGGSDGATLAGEPHVKLIELCCPSADCKQVLLVTKYDSNDPPLCDDHAVPMRPCQ